MHWLVYILVVLDHFVRWCASFCWLLSFFPFVLSVGFVIASIDRRTISYTQIVIFVANVAIHRSHTYEILFFFVQHILGCINVFIYSVATYSYMYSNSIDRYLIVYEVMRSIFTQYVWFLILDYNSIGIIIHICCMLTCIGHLHYIARQNLFERNLFSIAADPIDIAVSSNDTEKPINFKMEFIT